MSVPVQWEKAASPQLRAGIILIPSVEFHGIASFDPVSFSGNMIHLKELLIKWFLKDRHIRFQHAIDKEQLPVETKTFERGCIIIDRQKGAFVIKLSKISVYS